MNVEQAIEILKELPPKARLMCPDIVTGGSVEVMNFTELDSEWVDVELE